MRADTAGVLTPLEFDLTPPGFCAVGSVSNGTVNRSNLALTGACNSVQGPFSIRLNSSAIVRPCAAAAPGSRRFEGFASAPQPTTVKATTPGWSASMAAWAKPAQSPAIVFSFGSRVVQWHA